MESYQRHCFVTWNKINTDVIKFEIKVSADNVNFTKVATTENTSYFHFTKKDILEKYYITVEGIKLNGTILEKSDTLFIQEKEMTDDELLNMVQKQTFRYFYDFAHPFSGLTRERNTSGDVVTIGGSGFGIMALLVGIENGFITREDGIKRMIKILSFLQFADKFHGVFPHWMNGKTGDVVAFSEFDNGGDLVETSFLIQGLLTAKNYFNQENQNEKSIVKIIDKIWQDVEWDFYSKNNSGHLLWHWSPQHQWKINHKVQGYNEALIVYLLGISSPTHPVSSSYWESGWAKSNYKNGLNYYGQKLPVGPAYGGPLFFAHYSYLGFDPRNKKDKFTNYFVQNKAHSLINHLYCKANPQNYKGYSENCWGITASDDPAGYLAHEPVNRDNGTISPTAALSSIVYTPNESIKAIKHFYFELGEKLFGEYGFKDAFNENKNWFAESYLAIDQGPIICMIENYKTQLLWNNFMQNSEILDGLDKIGFTDDATSFPNDKTGINNIFFNNISHEEFVCINPENKNISISIFDQNGQLIEVQYFSESSFKYGQCLDTGIYFISIKIENLNLVSAKIIKI